MKERDADPRRPAAPGGPLFEALARAQEEALPAPGEDPRFHRETVERMVHGQASRGRWPVRSAPRVWLAVAGMGVAVAGMTAALVLLLRAPVLHYDVAGRSGATGQPLVAQADSELPLRFSDGSRVTFLPGSRGQVERVSDRGAEVAVEHGRLDLAVVHAASTRWVVHAGPFRVRVTGTRFQVEWHPSRRHLALSLREGSVVVEGDVLGEGVTLRAGQRLVVDAPSGRVRTEELEPPAQLGDRPAPSRPSRGADPSDPLAGLERGDAAGQAAPSRQATPSPSPSPSPPLVASRASAERSDAAGTDPGDRGTEPGLAPGEPDGALTGAATAHSRDVGAGGWRLLAERGDARGAWRAATRPGLARLARTLPARELLELGDVARYARAPTGARRLFRALVERYPGDPLAADALFSLGRLDSEAGKIQAARGWFDRYLRDWPRGPLAAQAAGRLLETMADAPPLAPATARRAAEVYLAETPAGPHAPRARAVLQTTSSGEAGR